MGNDKTHLENITHKRAKRSALSQQVITRLQGITVCQSLGKPRSAKRCSSGRIVLSHHHTHDTLLMYNNLHIPDDKAVWWSSVAQL